MLHFGIIGNPLGHSQSKVYFDRRFAAEAVDASYTEYPLRSIEEVRPLLQSLDGMNVTSPFKQQIIPYLQAVDPIAQTIGAVNVVSHGVGYNTDWLGVVDAFRPALLPDDRHALILGSGGAARAVGYGLQQLGLSVRYVSRSPHRADLAFSDHDYAALTCSDLDGAILTYSDLDDAIIAQCSVIANATPLGMAPHLDEAPPIPYDALTPHHLLFDCIYNPSETLFLRLARQHGARILNGRQMFLTQAAHAYRLYLGN